MDDVSMMDWQATPPAAEINAIYNPAMLERRRSRDEFEIPNMPGGWIDYYTERQFNVEDVVQFQHLARPSIVTCAKQAVGEAKRRCVQAAASACQAPIRLYQVVRGVRHAQAARRRRPASPRRSPRHSPRPSPRPSPRQPSLYSPIDAGASPQRTAFTTPTQVLGPAAPTAPNALPSPHTPTTKHDPYDITWDAPSPSHWLNLSYDVSFIDLNKTPETPPDTPIDARTLVSPIRPHTPCALTPAGSQLMAELEEAASWSGDAPATPTDHLPLTPQPKPYPSYMDGHDSEFPSIVEFSPEVADVSPRVHNSRFDLTEFSTNVPFSPDVVDVSSRIHKTRADLTEFSSHVPFSPEVADVSSRVDETGADVTEFSSNVPFIRDVTNISSRITEIAAKVDDLSYENAASTPDNVEISSHVADTATNVEKFLPNAPITSHTPEISSSVTETAAKAKKVSHNAPFTPDVANISSNVAETAAKAKKFLSAVPFTPDGAKFPTHIAETAADINSPNIVTGAHVSDIADDIDGFSSYVTDFPSHLVAPEWFEDPAVSPFNKSPESAPRRMTRGAVQKEIQKQQVQKERRLRNLQKAKIAALTDEWEDKVRKALKVGLDPDYTPADFARVVPPTHGGFTDSWLNDESVNGYLKLATKFHNTDHPSEIPRSHAFPSFMLTQIAQKGYKGVERWAKRAKIGGANLLKTHTIFIPVNSGSHWTLMVVYTGARTAHHYDSLGRNRLDSGRKWFDLLKIWLRGELGPEYNEREWSFFDKKSPQQDNSSDCGVFAVTTAKMLILGADVLGYGPNDIPLQRKRIVAELVNGNFL